MAPRPYWKGYLKLSLVSCPIALHAACSTAERIAFRQVNKQTVDEETREPVAPEHKGRGYEVVLAKRERVITLEPCEHGLLGTTHTGGVRCFGLRGPTSPAHCA